MFPPSSCARWRPRARRHCAAVADRELVRGVRCCPHWGAARSYDRTHPFYWPPSRNRFTQCADGAATGRGWFGGLSNALAVRPAWLLGLLFTPQAMVIAQTVLVAPIIAALTRQTIQDLWINTVTNSPQ